MVLLVMKKTSTIPILPAPGRLLTSAAVKARLGYRNKASFWAFVHRAGLPCIRLNARRIMFDQQQLEDWIASHSTTGRAA